MTIWNLWDSIFDAFDWNFKYSTKMRDLELHLNGPAFGEFGIPSDMNFGNFGKETSCIFMLSGILNFSIK